MANVSPEVKAARMIGATFGVLFIVIGFLSYAIYVNAPLGVFTVAPNRTPPVTAALAGAHNLAHDTIFIISAVIGVMAMVIPRQLFGGKGLALGVVFTLLSIILLGIEPALAARSLGAAYPTYHFATHVTVGILQVIVGALCFPLLRRPKM